MPVKSKRGLSSAGHNNDEGVGDSPCGLDAGKFCSSGTGAASAASDYGGVFHNADHRGMDMAGPKADDRNASGSINAFSGSGGPAAAMGEYA
ncbi:unnamed protein product [marine sediment metagenome]|uniref:Uncharacterized protein n=1 Tax=marine sediment metagenome TaxID=412755 RepID=X1UQ76_9ZZZZ